MSKVDGGLWALGRTSVPDRELIQIALDRQRCLPATGLDPAAVQRFVDQVMSRLTRASAMP
ncbi:hypothetical protein C1I98_25700 [Spongiactinospora gelatinilytica]|uniref:Uncharacterized protein n=1 Tax=Spongiactinospora gelatinilytica TaxID=2666298 RepID=A0A2W2GT49_9ACTN|nr:hypothetical protein C1I98_25700 [Spongiactinospora gelatinilytica]